MSLSECITILEELYEKDIKIKEGFHYYQARKIIRELNLKYLKVTLKKTKEWY
ncbi:MAG: hypothetical protein K6B68_02785 [Eubacterium sp.]|nr:hypothetical protein [Eubacterium sp.]